jgi:DNA-binding response OmpR family regulator/TolA-binding protein
LAKKKLLLVDADAKCLRILEVSLRKAGYSVTTAVSSQDAIKKLRLSAPDLILTDTKLPGGEDGFTLVADLKKAPDTAEVPIIFLSSENHLEQKVRGLELGVEDYLTKPIYLKEVLTRVRVLLEKLEKEHLEHRERSATFTGSIGEMGLVDLLQTIETGRKTGHLFLLSKSQKGTIAFREGKVVDARMGRLGAERAFYRMLVWSEGSFSMEFGVHDSPDVIELSPQGLLMEGLRRVDEWGRLLEQLPPLDRVFEIDFGELIDRLAEIPDEVNGILGLFDGGRSLLDVVDDSDFGDLEALEICSKLFFEGLIYDVANRRHELPAAGRADPVEAWLREEDERDDDVEPVSAPPPAAPRAQGAAFELAPPPGAEEPFKESLSLSPAAGLLPPRDEADTLIEELAPSSPPASAAPALSDDEGWEDVMAPDVLPIPEESVRPLLDSPPLPKVAAMDELINPLPSDLDDELAREFGHTPEELARAVGGEGVPTKPERPSSKLSEADEQGSQRPLPPLAQHHLDDTDKPLAIEPTGENTDDLLPFVQRRILGFSPAQFALLALGMILLGAGVAVVGSRANQGPAKRVVVVEARTAAPAMEDPSPEPEPVDADEVPQAPPPTPADAVPAEPKPEPKPEPPATAPVRDEPKPRVVEKVPPTQDKPASIVAPAKVAGEPAVPRQQSKEARYAKALKLAESHGRAGRWAKAAEAYKSALVLEPDSAAAHYALGNAFYEMDDISGAVKHLERARELNGKDPQVFLLLGAVHQTAGRNAAAIAAYERYLVLAPKGHFARDVTAILNSLKGS